jgi:hypothetical protein
MIANTTANVGLADLDRQAHVGMTKHIGRGAAILLALLFVAACSAKNEIQSTGGQELVEQGDAYMTCLTAYDLGCAYALLSPFAQELLDEAEMVTEGIVDLGTVIKTYGPRISAWTFNRAEFSTRDGRTIGSLEGEVQYADGKRGKVSLDFEMSDGTWKVRASDLEYQTGISLGLGN